MTVFKNYFKIINRHKFSILIYSFIFLLLALIFSTSDQQELGDYTSVKVPIYVINKSDSNLAKVLEEQLLSEFQEANIDENHLEDELFYERVSALITIPDDFAITHKVEFKAKENSQKGFLPKQYINQFLSKFETYIAAGFSEEDAIVNTKHDLEQKASVKFSTQLQSESEGHAESYFNFLHYVLISQIILIVTNVMNAYKKETILKRNEVSPVSNRSQSIQLILGHLFFAFFVWLSYMLIFTIFWSEGLSLVSTKLMMLNSFVFTIMVVTMAMFLSTLIAKENILQAVLNIVTLGTSFLAGAFVPQELLSETTLVISRLLPSYYYIKNNNMLVENPKFSTMSSGMFIMLAATAGFIILTFFIRQKADKKLQ